VPNYGAEVRHHILANKATIRKRNAMSAHIGEGQGRIEITSCSILSCTNSITSSSSSFGKEKPESSFNSVSSFSTTSARLSSSKSTSIALSGSVGANRGKGVMNGVSARFDRCVTSDFGKSSCVGATASTGDGAAKAQPLEYVGFLVNAGGRGVVVPSPA
jgi:hypothetical protein